MNKDEILSMIGDSLYGDVDDNAHERADTLNEIADMLRDGRLVTRASSDEIVWDGEYETLLKPVLCVLCSQPLELNDDGTLCRDEDDNPYHQHARLTGFPNWCSGRSTNTSRATAPDGAS